MWLLKKIFGKFESFFTDLNSLINNRFDASGITEAVVETQSTLEKIEDPVFM